MYGSLLLLLLAVATEAARSPRQKAQQRNPYVILPPGPGEDVRDGELPRNLDEKEFVRDALVLVVGRRGLTAHTDAEAYLPPRNTPIPGPASICGYS